MLEMCPQSPTYSTHTYILVVLSILFLFLKLIPFPAKHQHCPLQHQYLWDVHCLVSACVQSVVTVPIEIPHLCIHKYRNMYTNKARYQSCLDLNIICFSSGPKIQNDIFYCIIQPYVNAMCAIVNRSLLPPHQSTKSFAASCCRSQRGSICYKSVWRGL